MCQKLDILTLADWGMGDGAACPKCPLQKGLCLIIPPRSDLQKSDKSVPASRPVLQVQAPGLEPT